MKSLRNTYTASHLDFHLPPDVNNLGVNLNTKKFAKTLKDAHVDVVYLFTKCHYGHSYCDTKVGYKHPGLKTDLFGELLEACHKQGLGVIAYVSGAMNTHAAQTHPDWKPVDKQGGLGYGTAAMMGVCLISPYTDEVLIPHLAEVTRNYDMDAIMVDTMSSFYPCYCEHCRRLFRADTGQDIPKERTEKNWTAFARWRYDKCEEFVGKICRTVHQIKPDLPVNLNYMYSARHPLQIKHGMGYLTADVSSGLSRVDLLSRYYAGAKLPFEMMTVRFLHGYGDWTIKPSRMLKQEMAVIAANGGRCLLIDRQLPDGSLDEAYYKRLKSVFSFIHARKAALEDARTVEQIAVLNSAASAFGPDMEYFGELSSAYTAMCGAARMLAESTHHFTMINEHSLSESIGKYETVILPEQYYLDAKTIALLKNYVKNGGALLASHRSGFNQGAWELSELFGLDFVKDVNSEYMYLRLDDKDKSEFADLPILIHGKSAKFTPKGCKVLGGLYGPTLDKRYGWGTPPADYGWGVAPPAKTAAGPGITLHKYGKGRAIYVAGPIFESLQNFYNPAASYLVNKLLDLLVPKPLLEVECEKGVEVTLTRQPGNRINVHLINLNGEKKVGDWFVSESINPTGGIRVKLRATTRPVAVTNIPENGKMRFDYSGGIITLDIPKLDIHTCIQLKFAEEPESWALGGQKFQDDGVGVARDGCGRRGQS